MSKYTFLINPLVGFLIVRDILGKYVEACDECHVPIISIGISKYLKAISKCRIKEFCVGRYKTTR